MGHTGSARDFDFWVGDWDVYGPKGRQVGRNTVEFLFDGAAIAEHWRGAGGVEGRSLNAYEASRDRWHQTWVDSTGDLLMLDGGLVDGSDGPLGDSHHRRGCSCPTHHVDPRD